MEVAISNTPFQTQVHEWQQHHPSPVAEANPIENHWIKGSFNTYGKVNLFFKLLTTVQTKCFSSHLNFIQLVRLHRW